MVNLSEIIIHNDSRDKTDCRAHRATLMTLQFKHTIHDTGGSPGRQRTFQLQCRNDAAAGGIQTRSVSAATRHCSLTIRRGYRNSTLTSVQHNTPLTSVPGREASQFSPCPVRTPGQPSGQPDLPQCVPCL